MEPESTTTCLVECAVGVKDFLQSKEKEPLDNISTVKLCSNFGGTYGRQANQIHSKI